MCLGAKLQDHTLESNGAVADELLSNQHLAQPWRGVNLGGWLLLEPGTAKNLFAKHMDNGEEAKCEWDLMRILRANDAVNDLIVHRDTCVTRDDFRRIKECGLNAVRLPFGYWVLPGFLSGDEPYVGAALKYIDNAVDWADEFDLQIVLDLHGCPGGESGDAPCGRRQRPHGTWHHDQWNQAESLRALNFVAQRYAGRRCVTGVEVCNEPSNAIPADQLCSYYDMAVSVIRSNGMHADQVVVVLPLFQRSVDDFVREWKKVSVDKHENVCFDMHYYHCFENDWNGMTLAQQLRSAQAHAKELSRIPAVVGEWSLALGQASNLGQLPLREARALFGQVQLAAYDTASHGWFFWNWTDAHGPEWNWQECFKDFFTPRTTPTLPEWNGIGVDPLEDILDPPPADKRIRFGDSVYLRAYHGRHVDVSGPGSSASARYADRGEWQRFTILPVHDVDRVRRRPIANHDIVRLRAHTGSFIAVEGTRVVERAGNAPDLSADFILHTQGPDVLEHRCNIFLQSRATSCVLDIDGSSRSDSVCARWQDFGEWQRFVIEKAVTETLPESTRSVVDRGEPFCDATPQKRRRDLTPSRSSTEPVAVRRRVETGASKSSFETPIKATPPRTIRTAMLATWSITRKSLFGEY